MPTNHRLARPRKGDGNAVDVRRGEFAKVANTLQSVNNVTRDEFTAATNEILDNVRQLEVQFQRIAQMRADIDAIKRTLAKLTS